METRVLKSEFIHNRDNLLIGYACESGQLYRSILENRDNNEIEKLVNFYDFLRFNHWVIMSLCLIQWLNPLKN